jgi:hypothetical protein
MTDRAQHHRCGKGPRGPRGERPFSVNREEWLTRLEEHQRDLEQRTADVADLIRRLRQDPAPATAEA